jgi:hypothetical protein
MSFVVSVRFVFFQWLLLRILIAPKTILRNQNKFNKSCAITNSVEYRMFQLPIDSHVVVRAISMQKCMASGTMGNMRLSRAK